ncbi:hypothetical protein D1841_03520 [Neglecta sp. X4]|nr:hypothetical protein [Neglectibacter sp. 59]NBJ72408.1 hypothetical protein [Neglectibacter sp. X4]NCE80183.1 hypothetical protein [Neglectibacter sp. X58]
MAVGPGVGVGVGVGRFVGRWVGLGVTTGFAVEEGFVFCSFFNCFCASSIFSSVCFTASSLASTSSSSLALSYCSRGSPMWTSCPSDTKTSEITLSEVGKISCI